MGCPRSTTPQTTADVVIGIEVEKIARKSVHFSWEIKFTYLRASRRRQVIEAEGRMTTVRLLIRARTSRKTRKCTGLQKADA